ncbi:dienelactone hydrolase [Nocardiopsis mwathae]|uniref:Dienelactone hydrolase n=1 Tax=Nocardiopsis mwathae TaxID=1472723 RepID=A0A7X0D520_9ACTN|nr:alpha/beta family hydrolase [Nocardiopsis mwathae]MBB6171917.1 dienelactone hydrolase [Nocardiopsis mwathae]
MTNATPVTVTTPHATLNGDLAVPAGAPGIVVFVHGSGSSRHSPRNREVAATLNERGLATLLFDLLTEEEEAEDDIHREFRFDIDLLTDRLTHTIDWLNGGRETSRLPVGLFGASTGAAAAIRGAVERPDRVRAVVCRGGRVDLARQALDRVRAPVLLAVGSADDPIVRISHEAARRIRAPHQVYLVLGAGHLFVEPGALEEVARVSAEWFERHVAAAV